MAEYQPMVEETTETTGTGALLLAGATVGFRTFSSAFTEGDYLPYMLRASDGGLEWGYAQALDLAGTPDLARTFIHGSTNGGAALVLPAGEHFVSCGILPDLRQRRGCTFGYAYSGGLVDDFVTSGGFVEIHFASESWDSDNVFSAGNEFLVPAYVDMVRVHFGLGFDTNNAVGYRSVWAVGVDGDSQQPYGRGEVPGSAAAICNLEGHSGLIFLTGTPGVDKGIKIRAYQNSGISLDIVNSSTKCFFHMEFLG